MKERGAFIIDLNKCTGCHACETACQIANHVPGPRRWRRVRTFNAMHLHKVETSHLSLACNHCAEAPCMAQCPASAYRRDEMTGAVLIDTEKCLGCRYCAWVCPYGAPQFDEAAGVMAKCDFCNDRQHDGGQPACTSACPTGALSWARLEEGQLHAKATGLVEADTRPALRIEALRPTRQAPRQTEKPALPPWRALARLVPAMITLRHEWSLALFTWMAAVLVGLILGSLGSAPAIDGRLFLAVGLGSLALSASHLGQRARAWRAGLHPDESWLSREIILYALFLGLSSISLFLHTPPAVGVLAACLGLAALFAADRVYGKAVIRGCDDFHSALLFGSALLLASAWGGVLLGATGLAGMKMWQYAMRTSKRRRLGLPADPVTLVVRLGTLAVGASLVVAGGHHLAAFSVLAFSELIDRLGFYNELDVTTPESLMQEELERRAWMQIEGQ